MIVIRPAQPADAAAFADLADMASRGIFSYVFGKRVRAVLEGMFRQEGNDNSYQNTYFLEVGGKIAGMVNGYSQAHSLAKTLHTYRLFAQYAAWGVPGVIWRGLRFLPILNFIDTLPDEHFYVQFVAVYPVFRGQGLSMRLLEKADEIARGLGCTTLALDVEIHNTAAINAYLKHGMSQMRVSPTVRFHGEDAGLNLMEKPFIL
jgi:ribosomal protein S18 acetylase RimI-like enzyme